jgi:hypothetical protein
MAQRGRKSAAALAVVPAGEVLARLRPSANLTAEQRRVWLETVNARPADWFGPEQVPLLEGFCRHAAFAAALAGEINVCEPDWLKDEEGLKRYKTLLEMHERETRAMSSLATRLRLTNQALQDPKTAGRHGRRTPEGLKPWQTVDVESE